MSNLIKPRSIKRPVRDEIDGGWAGFHTEHWDDHVDARVTRGHVRVHVPHHGLLLGDGRALVTQRRYRELLGMRKVRGRPVIGGAAFASSGMYVTNVIDIYDATQLAIDLSLTTHKWAMYTNTLTPNFSTDVSYSATNEVSGTGYTAGGQVIVSPTNSESPTGSYMYDMNDQVWAAPTSVTARGSILYADALAGNNLIVAMTFGSDFTSTAGTFTIQFASTGVFAQDLTP